MINRSSGILLPIFSLPSEHGIGTLGKKAYEFVDFLVKAKQSYWQVLPIGPTGYGDSPYQSFSCFAGNPYFIDFDLLVEDGLLKKQDLKNFNNSKDVDYGYLYENKNKVLYKAYLNGNNKYKKEIVEFISNNYWLEDYALFMAIKKHFNMESWLNWPQDIRKRNKKQMDYFKELLKDDIDYHIFVQYIFNKQYIALKKYANDSGIKIIGDLPIYVAMDSCDVWVDPKQFQLDENLNPTLVAGVPPDYFSKDGQLWGNPLYDWEYMKSTGYKWWIERIAGNINYFDVIRIDHFRGFQEYWAVPYEHDTAKRGHWVFGPSLDFIIVLRDWFYDVDFIAEDLGIINEEVNRLLKESTFPGMRVLQFGVTKDGSSYHLPHNHIENCVCYVSTHDNIPINGWIKNAKKSDFNIVKKYYGLNEEEGYNYGYIRAGMSSIAKLFICQMQDYLGLGDEGTINNPGTLGNWKWRISEKQLSDTMAKKIADLTYRYARCKKD